MNQVKRFRKKEPFLNGNQAREASPQTDPSSVTSTAEDGRGFRQGGPFPSMRYLLRSREAD